MLIIQTLLEFDQIFPEEVSPEILSLLKKVDNDVLLNIIGFTNTKFQTNYYNFFKNKELQNLIIKKTEVYLNNNPIIANPIVISRIGALKLAEIILYEKENIFKENKELSYDLQELYLFKSFLLVNKIINKERKPIVGNNWFEELLNFSISYTFPFSDLGLNNSDFEFLKLLFATLIKQDYLIKFLNSDERFTSLKRELAKSFYKKSLEELSTETKYLFGTLIELKFKNLFKLNIRKEESKLFLDTLCSEIISIDSDFTNLKNSPLYKLDENLYSIVDYFFVIDKFYKSVKFKLNNIYSKDSKLNSEFGDFFSFYNLYFSEKILMKNVLDEIFINKHFHKLDLPDLELPNQPDYYVRHNNNIFIFENKDVFISRDIKSSGSIDKIENTLKNKLLIDGKRRVGIGQLINHIEYIVNGNFKFDEKVNKKKYNIYPVLILHDRIFETLGLNYKLNIWFQMSIKERLGSQYNTNYIKNLTIIDIDSLIYLTSYFKIRDNNFKDLVSNHLKIMTKHKKVNHKDPLKKIEIANRNISQQLAPISSRVNYSLPKKILMQLLTNNKIQ